MMEGADKTTEFIENMADFFRYNIKKMNQDTTIGEEIHLHIAQGGKQYRVTARVVFKLFIVQGINAVLNVPVN